MTGGVLTALDQVVGDQVEAEAFVQAALFEPEEIGALDAPSPLSGAVVPRKRGPGRPPGSRNRRTEAVAGWLLSQHRHPVAVMMEAYSMTPDELAKAAGFEEVTDALRLELLKLQMKMAEASAAYVAQKLPQAVDLKGSAGLTVVFGGVSLPARGGLAGGGDQVVDGQVLGVRVRKSDEASRTDG